MADSTETLLIIRLGAMGDIIHALPALASLRLSFPQMRLVWVAACKWLPLFEGNPQLNDVIPYSRSSMAHLSATWKKLRAVKAEVAIDFQGLIQSALVGRMSGAAQLVGLDRSLAREKPASFFYTETVVAPGPHRVERCLQLAAAAGATNMTNEAWIPLGQPEGELPQEPFVLANPFAGWVSKQWPIDYYAALAKRLKMPLVVNVPESKADELRRFPALRVHSSSIAGLIDATRRAAKVVGVDSGPLHIAAALKKPGVAIYGPTDPAQTGPFNCPMKILRAPAETTYKRGKTVHSSMSAISVDQVAEALSLS